MTPPIGFADPTPKLADGAIDELRPGALPAGRVPFEPVDDGAEKDDHFARMHAEVLDWAAVRLAQARSLVPVWKAELLHRMDSTRGFMLAGRSSLRDYAREELGMTPSQVRECLRLGRALADFPSLRPPLLDGRLTVSQARSLLKVVKTDTDVKEHVARLGTMSRAAWRADVEGEARMRAEEGGVKAVTLDDDEPLKRRSYAVTTDERARFLALVELCRQLEGRATTQGQAVEMLCGEWLSGNVVPDVPKASTFHLPKIAAPPRFPILSELWRNLERSTNHWEFLDWKRPRLDLAADLRQELTVPTQDGLEIHRRLKVLCRLEQELDWQMGRVLHALRRFQVPTRARFDSFAHYAVERLGMSERRARYLLALAERLLALPKLDAAYRDGEVTWYQAMLIAKLSIDEPAQAAWIARARAVTVQRLKEEVEATETSGVTNPYPPHDPDATPAERPPAGVEAPAPARAANVRIAFVVPEDVGDLVDLAIASVRATCNDPTLPVGRCFAIMIDHFVATHNGEPAKRMRRKYAIFERDGWRCQMPGCTSPELQAHHIVFRAQGGSDEPYNLLSVCWPCHHWLIHGGRVRVERQEGEQLEVHLGCRFGREPLSKWLGERRIDRGRQAARASSQSGGAGDSVGVSSGAEAL